MTVVGAYARIDPASHRSVRARLGAIEGIELFSLDDAGKVGLVIEARDLDDARARLLAIAGDVDGVLGVWPISVHLEGGDQTAPGEKNQENRTSLEA